MSTRTTRKLVTFRHAFTLSSLQGMQPAGTYELEVDEDQIDGLSFNAFRRMTTILYLPADPAPGCTRQAVEVDPEELAGALAGDDDSNRPGQPS